MRHAADLVVFNLASSRLKPVLQAASLIVPTLCVQRRLKPVSLTVRAAVSGTGFSREDAGLDAVDFLANTIPVGVSLLTKTACRALKI